MRTIRTILATLVVAGLVATPMSGFAAKSTQAAGNRVSAATLTPLSEAEVVTLKWMREEEKLARDVYLELNAFWPARVFTNIAASEQKHFDAIGRKLALYGIADPALPNIGDFADPALQALHDELLALGMVSFVEALQVGVTIEETDIVDLQAAIDGTASVPLRTTYQHLLKGSENHLRAFIKVLERQGVVYEP